ncbi:MAG: hypothetical protein M3R24_03940 [Chloroflexota bacterium]|nr:hypothetical protein [Chloroflexota bacterium]
MLRGIRGAAHLLARVLTVRRTDQPHGLRDVDGMEVRMAEARAICYASTLQAVEAPLLDLIVCVFPIRIERGQPLDNAMFARFESPPA